MGIMDQITRSVAYADGGIIHEPCFACGKKMKSTKHLVDTRDDQKVFVGPDCFKKVKSSGDIGHQPPRGGPKLWLLPKEAKAKGGAVKGPAGYHVLDQHGFVHARHKTEAGARQAMERLPERKAWLSPQELRIHTVHNATDFTGRHDWPIHKSSGGFAEGKAKAEALEAEFRKHSAILNSYPKNAMGMTADEHKNKPEWKTAHLAKNAAFKKLQDHNAVFTKQYHKEIVADRDARRAAKLKGQG